MIGAAMRPPAALLASITNPSPVSGFKKKFARQPSLPNP